MEIKDILQSMNLAYTNAQNAKDRGDEQGFWYHKDIWERLKKELDIHLRLSELNVESWVEELHPAN